MVYDMEIKNKENIQITDKTKEMSLTECDLDGLAKMKALIAEFLESKKGSDKVRDFLKSAKQNDSLLLIYLKGRTYRPEYAWKTLKRKAEVRFDSYPEVFEEKPASFHEYFQKEGIWGILKSRDKLGRRVICVDFVKWDPAVILPVDSTNAAVYITETLLHDKDGLENGVVFVQNCEGMGWNHAKQFTLPNMLRMVNVFLLASPIKFKGIYYINVPSPFTFIFGLIKPFLSQKLRERIILTTASKGFTEIHEKIDPSVLPKYLGGPLENDEAFEWVDFNALTA